MCTYQDITRVFEHTQDITCAAHANIFQVSHL